MKNGETMELERRLFALVGGAALIAATATPAVAQADDAGMVARRVEALRVAMLEPDRRTLEGLCAEQLSYGQSAGRIETRVQFIDALVNRTSVFRSITQTEQTIGLASNVATVRHLLNGETLSGTTVTPVRIGVLQMWQKQGDAWLLLARQAFRL